MPVAVLNGCRHYHRLDGFPDRPPLMLVHPIGADLSLWDKAVASLTPHFHVLRYDLRGHGGSEVTPGDYGVDMLAADLLALADFVGWKQFALCGVSIGAMASLRAATLAPDRISHLIVCSAAPVMGQPPGGWDARAQATRERGLAGSADAMTVRMFSADHVASGDPLVATLREVYARTDADGYANCLAVLRDTDLRPVLNQVVAPTLIVTGALDPLVPATAAQAFVEGISGATHVALECGHFPPVERAVEFAEHVQRFAANA